jgi:hypothetical protein
MRYFEAGRTSFLKKKRRPARGSKKTFINDGCLAAKLGPLNSRR